MTERKPMECDSVNFSKLESLTTDQTLLFHGGINLIEGPFGYDKLTTIFRELEKQYREHFKRNDLPIELAVKLVFIGEGHCSSAENAISIIDSINAMNDLPCLRVLPQLISHYINQLIAPKVMWYVRGSDSADTRYPFKVSITDSGAPKVCDAKGNSVNFSARSWENRSCIHSPAIWLFAT